MSSEKRHRLRNTLAFRLTLWYAGVFTLSSFIAFGAFYLLVRSHIKGLTDQELSNELLEYSSLLSIKGLETLKTVLFLEAQSEGVHKVFFRIVTPEGEVIASTNMKGWGDMGVDRAALGRLNRGAGQVFDTVAVPGRENDARILYGRMGQGKILQIGLSLEESKRFMNAFRGIFSKLLLFLMAFAGLIGWFMAKRALQGVEEVTRTARDISSNGDLEKRVPLKTRGKEIDRLATTFNSMLDRIRALVKGMREMTDNIAHDLKSPITRIRGSAEMALTAGRSLEEYQAMSATTIEECDRLIEMINTMLDISEAETGTGALRMETLNMARVAGDACSLFQPMAEDRGVSILSNLPEASPVEGDVRKLQRLVANLLDNAIKYTPPQGRVEVSLRDGDDKAVLSIKDSGIGILHEDLPHVFERFHRCDRSRSEPGAGLGLSLALAIARAHGGDIKVESVPGEGTTFTVTLPRRPVPQ